AKSLRGHGIEAQVVPVEAVVGGGGAPGTVLPSCAIALPAYLARRLRTGTPPVVGRVVRDQLLLDLRCVLDADDHQVLAAVIKAAAA
ncbi:L-seryl-tRNA(Sec) selenium transferase, partial [Streptomyces sp. 2MCAF27]